MIAIPVKSEKYGLKHFFIDGEDFEKVKGFTWSINHKRDNAVVSKTKGKDRKGIKLHRLIMGADENSIVDHKDGNPLNNQKENLRICDRTENNCNRKISILESKTSKYKGVSFKSEQKKYIAQIQISGIKKHIGYFDNEIEAAKAYNKSAIKLHGEFARLNIIEYK